MRIPKRRYPPEMNRGSMADIAFMMLVFFMVVTTEKMDWGIEMKLPPWSDEFNPLPPSELPVAFRIDINNKNEIMADADIVDVSEVKVRFKLFFKDHVNRGLVPVIQFRTNRYSSYNTYISIVNEIKAAYIELWSEVAQNLFYKDYNLTTLEEKRIIRTQYPFAIMELESKIYPRTY